MGFSWIIEGVRRYFEFNVLPFGLTSTHLLFTKILKPLVTHWRASGIFVAQYLDDGFVVVPRFSDSIETDFSFAKEVSKHVRIDPLRAGFVYNVEKSKWDPSTIVEWLGMTWNT